MTGSDAIVVAPWLVFAVGVTVICVQLVRSGHPACRRRPTRPDGRRRRASTKPCAPLAEIRSTRRGTRERWR